MAAAAAGDAPSAHDGANDVEAAEGGAGAGQAAAPAATRKTKSGGASDILPASVVARVVKGALPPGSNVSKDAKSAFAKAASIFVLYLGAAANDACREGRRSTINAKDVLTALNELEFDELVDPLKDFLIAYRTEAEKKKASKKRAREESEADKVSGGAGAEGAKVPQAAGAGAGAGGGGLHSANDAAGEAEDDPTSRPSPPKRTAIE